MSQSSKSAATLLVDIKSTKESIGVPKQIQVLGADLSLKSSAWINDSKWQQEVPSGVYVVRLNFSSGKQLEQVVDLTDKQTAVTTFDTSHIAPDEPLDFRHFVKSNAGPAVKSASFRDKSIPLFLQNVSAYRWLKNDNGWTNSPEPTMQDQLITQEASTYVLKTGQRLELLQFVIPEGDSLFVCLPPSQQIDCQVKVMENPISGRPGLDVCIITQNFKAQSLLSLITSGDIGKARSLVSAKEAEQLLYQKLVDPASAAIGGYYLLKTGDLEKMHNWAENLARFFPWFPDGKILYAWQLIQQQSAEQTIPIALIRELLLDAIKSGIPVFTEGLRLLYEAINMLAFEVSGSDTAVVNARSLIRRYIDTADMGQETSTFFGNTPDDPGYNPKKSQTLPLR